MPLLDVGMSSSLKTELLKSKGFAAALLKELQHDPPELVEAVLGQLWSGVVKDQRVELDIRLHLLEAAWEPVGPSFCHQFVRDDILLRSSDFTSARTPRGTCRSPKLHTVSCSPRRRCSPASRQRALVAFLVLSSAFSNPSTMSVRATSSNTPFARVQSC